MNSYFNEWITIILVLFPMVGMVILLVVWSIKNGISPMPTSTKAKPYLFELLPSNLQGKIYELGSGWGTLLFPLARRFPHSEVVGFETSPLPFCFSSLWMLKERVSNVKVFRKDFFFEDLSKASLVVCYLYPGAMLKLKGKFEKELKPGALVVCNTFAVPGWIPERVIEVPDLYHTKIYLYKAQ